MILKLSISSANKSNNILIRKDIWSKISGSLGLIVFLLAGFNFIGCVPLDREPAAGTGTSLERFSHLENQWGIRPESLRLSGAGYIVDFRYKVIDPEKAVKILSNPEIPYLIDQSTGTKLGVPSSPKVGSLRQTTDVPEAGRIYFSLFSNTQKIVKSGSTVTVVMGEFKAEDLVVQ